MQPGGHSLKRKYQPQTIHLRDLELPTARSSVIKEEYTIQFLFENPPLFHLYTN